LQPKAEWSKAGPTCCRQHKYLHTTAAHIKIAATHFTATQFEARGSAKGCVGVTIKPNAVADLPMADVRLLMPEVQGRDPAACARGQSPAKSPGASQPPTASPTTPQRSRTTRTNTGAPLTASPLKMANAEHKRQRASDTEAQLRATIKRLKVTLRVAVACMHACHLGSSLRSNTGERCTLALAGVHTHGSVCVRGW